MLLSNQIHFLACNGIKQTKLYTMQYHHIRTCGCSTSRGELFWLDIGLHIELCDWMVWLSTEQSLALPSTNFYYAEPAPTCYIPCLQWYAKLWQKSKVRHVRVFTERPCCPCYSCSLLTWWECRFHLPVATVVVPKRISFDYLGSFRSKRGKMRCS